MPEDAEDDVVIEAAPDLCASCQALNLPLAFWQDKPNHKPNLEDHSAFQSPEDLRQSALTCPLCELVQDGLEEYCKRQETLYRSFLPSQTLQGPWTTAKKKVSCATSHDFSVMFDLAEDKWRRISVRTFVSVGRAENITAGEDSGNFGHSVILPPRYRWKQEKGTENFTVVYPIDRDPSSLSTKNRLLDWVAECDAKHDHCPKTTDTATTRFMPDRLLYVGTQSSPALRVCQHVDEYASYVALSYRWGDRRTKTLIQENLDAFQIGIDDTTLEATIRDAVEVARWLNIQYLWVDGLCIIQDDAADWEQQSAQMAEIYRNACLTISATNAPNVETGFLRERRPLVVRCGTIYEKNNMARGVPIFLSLDCTLHNTLESYDLQTEPLIKRGWTVQERHLSPRLVHFASRQMIFECQSGTKMENGCKSERSGCKSKHSNSVERPLGYMSMRDWYNVVQEYSKCELTNHTDRLPALSGLASWYHKQHPKSEYLAGHWDSDLLQSLIWNRQRYASPNCSERLRCPSWSWSSVDGEVGFRRFDQDIAPAADVISASVQTKGMNPYGEVTSGRLELCAPMLYCSYDEWKNQCDIIEFRSRQGNRCLRGALFFDCCWPKGEICVIVLILEVQRKTKSSPHSKAHGCIRSVAGLIVQSTGEEREYERIGMFAALPCVDKFQLPQPSLVHLI